MIWERWTFRYCESRSRYHIHRATGRLVAVVRGDSDPSALGEARSIAADIAQLPEAKRVLCWLLWREMRRRRDQRQRRAIP